MTSAGTTNGTAATSGPATGTAIAAPAAPAAPAIPTTPAGPAVPLDSSASATHGVYAVPITTATATAHEAKLATLGTQQPQTYSSSNTTVTSDSIPVQKMFTAASSYPKKISNLGQVDADAMVEQSIPATRINDEMVAIKRGVAYRANASFQATTGSSTVYHDCNSTSSQAGTTLI